MNENNENVHDTLLNELEKLTKTLIQVDSTANISTSGANTSAIPSNTSLVPQTSTVPLTNDNLSEFIYDKSQKLINLCMDTLENTRTNLTTTLDAEEIEAFAGLIKATTAAIDTLNDINIEKQKIKAAKKIKKLDIAAKKQLNETGGKTTNNILIAGREDIMKMIAENNGKISSAPIDADFEEKS